MALGRYRLYYWFRFLGQSAHPHRRFRGNYPGCGVLHSGTCSTGHSKSSRRTACTALLVQRSTLFLSTLCSSAYDRWSIARREYTPGHNPYIDIGPGAFLSMCVMFTVLTFPILASSTTLAHPATCRAAVALRGLCVYSILHIHNRYDRIDIVATRYRWTLRCSQHAGTAFLFRCGLYTCIHVSSQIHEEAAAQ